MKLERLLEGCRDKIAALAKEHGVIRIRAFGSFVRDEARPESDLDILIQLQSDRSLLDLIGFKQDLETLLRRKVDVVSEGGLSPYLRDRILKEAVSI